MESDAMIIKPPPQSNMAQRLVPAVLPLLFVAITYVDPGKWVAAIEGGARFGYDLVLLMFVFSLAAVLCHYLSACIAVVTGRDLAEICSAEYDTITCILLGVQAEISMIALDLSMILGTAHAINFTFGINLFTCVLLTSVDAFLFPFFSNLLEIGKAKFICIWLATIALFSYLFGVVLSQRDASISISGLLMKLSGESVFVLMSQLGASIMPHNFYLHSSMVKQNQGSTKASKEELCHDHLYAIACVFSGIFVVNYILTNSAANVFYSTGLDLLTFQDALSLIDQVFMAPFALILLLLLSNHTSALTWKFSGQTVLVNFFKIEIPGWYHHSTIRSIAIVPALFCSWNSGAEGTYQLMIFTQILIALLLPSSVIPLFRIASSRTIMGANKISQFLEYLILIAYIGMLTIGIVFVVEMVFGNSDWANNLRWTVGPTTIVSVPFIFAVLVTAFSSVFFMIWLVVTPLKSSAGGSRPNSSQKRVEPVPETEKWVDQVPEPEEESREKVETIPEKEKKSDREFNLNLNLPEELLDLDKDSSCLTTIEENSSFSDVGPVTIVENVPKWGPLSDANELKKEVPKWGPLSDANELKKEVPKWDPLSDANELKNLPKWGPLSDANELKKEEEDDMVEKTLRIDGNLLIVKEKDQERDIWEEPETKTVSSETDRSPTSNGPSSFKNINIVGKTENDIGSGPASLSKLAGLGRAARRQLATTLDEFWKLLFDLHGELTPDARNNKLDKLLGIDSKPNLKANTVGPVNRANLDHEFNGYNPTVTSGFSSGLSDSVYGVPPGSSSLLSTYQQLLDVYAQNPNQGLSSMDPEKRYHSLRLPQASGGFVDQPATVHGYQIKSYINQMKQNVGPGSDSFGNPMEPYSPKSVGSLRYQSGPVSLTKTQQNGLRPAKPPGFPDPVVSRNHHNFQSLGATAPVEIPERNHRNFQPSGGPAHVEITERNHHNLQPSWAPAPVAPVENTHEKKYYSMPDISGLLPHRDSKKTTVTERDGPARYGTLGPSSVYPAGGGQGPLYRTASVFSNSNLSRDAAAYQPVSSYGLGSGTDTWSMWTRQPSEQFGVAEKFGGSNPQTSPDSEANVLKSLRVCIVKLLKLEGSEWLFNQNGGLDEDLVDRVAARERFLYEVESTEFNRAAAVVRGGGARSGVDETEYNKYLVNSVTNCGEGCVWRIEMIKSFGVWCIRRILELSLMESRPELWGKYTYVLNRLQGIIEPAFAKPRSPPNPCFCLHLPESYHHRRSSPPKSLGTLLPKSTTAASLLDIVKDVETAISCRKGRPGTAAGDVAFPKGKENLASVLKRYKRRLVAAGGGGGDGHSRSP